MRLTTKGRFAVIALIDIAVNDRQNPVTLATISQRQNISLPYLEQLFAKLRRAGLVDSLRGPGGGYVFAKSLDQISVADILFAVDEPIDATSCAGQENCSVGTNGAVGRCMTHELWSNLNHKMLEYLESVTLQQLLDQQAAKEMALISVPKVKRA